MKYFAYGSNMCTNRLRDRVPSCRFHAVATLQGHTLKFHKCSTDGSGKCNALRTGSQLDYVIGVVFEVDSAEKPRLDLAEGLHHGYEDTCVSVASSQGPIEAWMYVADQTAIDDRLAPYTWYKDFVLGGAREHGLPDAYIAGVEAVEAWQDRDQTREQENRRLLPCSS